MDSMPMAPAPSFEGPNYPSPVIQADDNGNPIGDQGIVFAGALPKGGDYPYLTPDKKTGRPVRLPNRNYRDSAGREWQWNKNQNEWDVQSRDGKGHVNVDENGNKTHGSDDYWHRSTDWSGWKARRPSSARSVRVSYRCQSE